MDRLQQTNEMFGKLKVDMPKEIAAFINFSQANKQDGQISKKYKELILVALGISSQCNWCIAMHVKGAIDAGCSKEEILEAAMLAVVMGGGPKLMYMSVLYEELEKY
ncbi:carboxymuconolactone decarboxylase family protein [Sulfuricurvum sp.]|uniref:carboxymuconolactone decarboxylase family protein n=1 Tax=Sulfuricurvum sp. TaxID=2025608 RepID=UPI003BB7EF80